MRGQQHKGKSRIYIRFLCTNIFVQAWRKLQKFSDGFEPLLDPRTVAEIDPAPLEYKWTPSNVVNVWRRGSSFSPLPAKLWGLELTLIFCNNDVNCASIQPPA